MKQKFTPYALCLMPYALCLMPYTAFSAVRVGNLSRNYADSYGQVNNMRMGTVGGKNAATQNTGNYVPDAGVTRTIDATGATVELPLRVANAGLAKKIGMGETVGRVNLKTLENCARIYPNAEFAWDTPTAGAGAGGAQTCVGVVELRVANGDGRGNTLVLARANLAAGDNMKCNISDFPEYSYTEEAGKIEFPADAEPTMADVIAQMNEEQKQNAGIKIAAGAIVGALGGNIAGKGEPGSDSILGTGKDKMTSSVVGALSGAAIMAGNSYGGKVGGDVILSTDVNAVAGGIVGNIMASGNSVLRVEDCETPNGHESCLWGTVVKTDDFEIKGEGAEKGEVVAAYYNLNTGDTRVCRKVKEDDKKTECKSERLLNVRLEGVTGTVEELKKKNWNGVSQKYYYDNADGTIKAGEGDGKDAYAKIASAVKEEGLHVPAMVSPVRDKAMGLTMDDWNKLRDKGGLTIWGRDADGKGYRLDEKFELVGFKPKTIDAEDGGIVDISNKARLKTTMTGAGVGGAMGAFVGYQGAQSDIDERWLSAVREYKDSLSRVYCISGDRYMGQYNAVIDINPLDEEE